MKNRIVLAYRKHRRFIRRLFKSFFAIACLPWVVLIILAIFTPLPASLTPQATSLSSVRVLDRNGNTLAEVRSSDGSRASWVSLDTCGAVIPHAILAAEDKRFYFHPGVDPVAVLRALGQNLWHREVVSGASTLTQQLARTVVPRPRTVIGKVREMSVALRIEASLSKRNILEYYINLVHFGPSLRGIEAASRYYFDKPARAVSLAEAATLAAIPRGPTLYNPRRNPQGLRARRDRILDRMLASGWASSDDVARASKEPITVHLHPTGFAAPHLIRGVLSGTIEPWLAPSVGKLSSITTTLDAELQRDAQSAARNTVSSLQDRGVSAASVIVLDNASAEVLAWVGAPDFLDEARLGQNDGVLAARQPGSTLKPFVYGIAIEDLGLTPATVLPDTELHLNGAQGTYTPQNYDGRLHGPVRLREALANSYNIPAVYTAHVVGPSRILPRLRELGMRTLTENADYYGAAIALGDGEVRLMDLALAYTALANGGMFRLLSAVTKAKDHRGQEIPVPERTTTRVFHETTAALLTDILKDQGARIASFGPDSVLDFPFDVAAKTGTSKGFRDNLTVGFSRDVTVAVWVGNFDGSPMQAVSGIMGAGPLFRTVMLAAMKHRAPRLFELPNAIVDNVEVCALSGELPTPICHHKTVEHFARGTAPQRPCSMHVEVDVDQRSMLRAGPQCPGTHIVRLPFEVYDERFAAWAISAHRPIAPRGFAPSCPAALRATGDNQEDNGATISIRYPYDGAIFTWDPSLPAHAQGIVAIAYAPSWVKTVRLFLDGALLGMRKAPFEFPVPLSPGPHCVRAQAEGIRAVATNCFEVH